METTRPTKEANNRTRAKWLYQTKEQKGADLSVWKKVARDKKNAKALKRAEKEERQNKERKMRRGI